SRRFSIARAWSIDRLLFRLRGRDVPHPIMCLVVPRLLTRQFRLHHLLECLLDPLPCFRCEVREALCGIKRFSHVILPRLCPLFIDPRAPTCPKQWQSNEDHLSSST